MVIPPTLFYWLTDDHTVERCPDIAAWGAWMEEPGNCRVAETTLHDGRRVSTVFLGIDHQWTNSVTPIVFETMVFTARHTGREDDDAPMERYATWDEAEKGHWFIVRKCTLSLCEEVS